jgi:DNA-binding GntR family transcriptional regulator
MQDNDQMAQPTGGPAYQHVADDLRRRIASEEFPIASAIPSTAKLSSMYGVSVTVVRAAVAQLRADGLVTGYPGKGVFVSSTPDAVAKRTATVEALARQVEELRQAESTRRGETASQLAALRSEIALLRAQISDLYAHLGITHSDG